MTEYERLRESYGLLNASGVRLSIGYVRVDSTLVPPQRRPQAMHLQRDEFID